MGSKNKNRRQHFPPISAVALAAEPEPTTHAVLTIESDARAEDMAWTWFALDEYRRGHNAGKTSKQVSRSLRRNSFLAGYRAGQRAAWAARS